MLKNIWTVETKVDGKWETYRLYDTRDDARWHITVVRDSWNLSMKEARIRKYVRDNNSRG